MRRNLLMLAIAAMAAVSSPVQAIEWKDCSSIKDAKLRMDCLERNSVALKNALEALEKGSLVGRKVQLSTRGRCLSYFDENQAPRTMTCDHRDLQEWTIQPY
jgi:hypothetical protein